MTPSNEHPMGQGGPIAVDRPPHPPPRRPHRVRAVGRPLVRALGLATVLAAIAGCGAAADEDPEAVIRGWNRAVNAGDYDRAGAFFAPNAVIQQVEEMRLRGPADGARFSASLPCRAELTEVIIEQRSSLAIFRLRDGQSPCSGAAEVRFAVRDGKLTEWRQLPPRPPARGLQTSNPTRSTRSASGPFRGSAT